MDEIKNFQRFNRDEATLHLFTKLKYELSLHICAKLMQWVKQSKDKVVISVGKEQRSYPAILVRSFTNIRSVNAALSNKYDIQEVMNLFDIIMNLPEYKCNGLTQDYTDWKPISNIVNMTELANSLGMQEVEKFLRKIPDLLTEHNKNAYDNEIQRRERRKQDDSELEQSQSRVITNTSSHEVERSRRPRSKSRSFSKTLFRSLSRGRNDKKSD